MESVDRIIEILEKESEEIKQEFPEMEPSLILTKFNQEELEDLEKGFNIKIPKDHREFIKKYSPKKFHVMFTDIFGIEKLRTELNDYIPEEVVRANYLPFAGSEGDYYCLRMDLDDKRVYLYYHDVGKLVDMGISFEKFFKNLLDEKLDWNKKMEE